MLHGRSAREGKGDKVTKRVIFIALGRGKREVEESEESGRGKKAPRRRILCIDNVKFISGTRCTCRDWTMMTS